jgi:predicted phosphoadenosine phosphosulfate sulfurtransferase
MVRYRRFIDTNVLDEAKARIHHVYDLFDAVVVAFSGGKDSLALLHLVREVARERGIDHVHVVFRDEELIPDQVIDFVNEYRQLPWVRMTWFAVPLQSTKFILGKSSRYLQWDPDREHIRPIPPWATTLADLDMPPDTELSQYDMDALTARPFKGRVAITTGVRAAESLIRWQASVAKLSENYINASSTRKASLVKPLFDWHENDVFRYFYDRGIRYCPLYDAQATAGSELRVSTPLHAESAKHIGLLRATAPTFYNQLMDLFPEMLVQERYWRELDREGVKERYAASWESIEEWILGNIDDPQQQALALKRLATVRTRTETDPGAYPRIYVLRMMMSGSYKREIPPLSEKNRPKELEARKKGRAP